MRSLRSSELLWTATVIVALALQLTFLRSSAVHTVAPYVPLWADQIQYLAEAYKGFDLIARDGPITGTVEALRQTRTQGWLLQTMASLFMSLVGPSRMAALDLSFVFAVAWLGITTVVLKKRFGAWVSLCALGLLVSTGTFTLGPGGPFDFRLDFATTCLWGGLVAVIATATGRERPWYYVIVAASGLILMTTRLLSGFYLVPFGISLIALSMLLNAKERGLGASARWWMMITAVWAIALALIIGTNFETFSNYYIRGHVTGGRGRRSAFGRGRMELERRFSLLSSPGSCRSSGYGLHRTLRRIVDRELPLSPQD